VSAVKSASNALGVQLVFAPAASASELAEAFSVMAQQGASGVLVLSSPLYTAQAVLLAELQTKHRLAAIFANRANVDVGGFASYGADLADLYRRSASYIAKIFKGTPPTDLPVEQATKYFMVFNLKTAKILGVTIPATLLARADEVIE
jgi:putative ABC transport system substrate-binding protein